MAFGPIKNPSGTSRRAIDFGLGTRINGHAEAPRRASGRDRGKPLRKPLEPTKIGNRQTGYTEDARQQPRKERHPSKRTPGESRTKSAIGKSPGAKSSQQGRDRHHDEGGILAKTLRGRQDPTEPTTEPTNNGDRRSSKGALRESDSNRGQRVLEAGVYGRRPAARHRTKTNCEQKVERKNQQQSSSRRRSSSKGAGAARNRRTKSQNKNVERKNTNIGERGNSQLARKRVC